MLKGIPSNQDPLITFDLSGPANGKRGYYDWNKTQLRSRIAVAWTPHASGNGWWKKLIGGNDKTVVRAGFGMVYDRVGMGLLNTFDSERIIRSCDRADESCRLSRPHRRPRA